MPKDISLREWKVIRQDWERDPEGTEERFLEALTSGQVQARHLSIREMFEGLVEDGSEIVKQFDPRWGAKRGINLVEAGAAVDSSAFANINGQIVFSTVLKPYKHETDILDDLMENVPTRFNGEKIPGIGEIGDETEAVDEGHAYPNLGVNEEWIETPMTRKQGGIIPLTKEATFFDRTNVLLDRCSKLGKWLGINKLKQGLATVFGLTFNGFNYNTYRRNGVATNTYLSSGAYVNQLPATPLVDWTSVQAAELVLSQILDPNTGQPVIMEPDTLLVPIPLKHTARRIMNATQTRSVFPSFTSTANAPAPGNVEMISDGKVIDDYEVVSSRWIKFILAAATGFTGSTTGSWWFGNFKEAFCWMENWPITVVQAPTNSEAEFTQDIIMRWKASHRGFPAVRQPRAVCRVDPT